MSPINASSDHVPLQFNAVQSGLQWCATCHSYPTCTALLPLASSAVQVHTQWRTSWVRMILCIIYKHNFMKNLQWFLVHSLAFNQSQNSNTRAASGKPSLWGRTCSLQVHTTFTLNEKGTLEGVFVLGEHGAVTSTCSSNVRRRHRPKPSFISLKRQLCCSCRLCN